MSLCINPSCPKPQNAENQLFCQACSSELLLAGRYRVTRLLSDKGGFGNTYEVIHHKTLKVLKVLTNNHPKAVELFEQEAQVLSQLNHPGIPKGEGDFTYFPRNNQTPLHCLVMEKIEGMDLEEYQKHRENCPIDQKLALEWLTQLAEILHEVHGHNFFHRDIKPSNIILRADGQLVLIDFGAVRQVTATIMAGGQNTGIYTPGYAPPEQEKGYAVPQSDFYALGRTFVYLLTGKTPTDTAMYDRYKNELNWRTHSPNIAPELADFIDNLMAEKANERPGNTSVILQQLTEIDRVINPPSEPPVTPVPPVPPTVVKPPVTPPAPRTVSWTRRRFAKVIGLVGVGGVGLVAAALISEVFKSKPLIVSKLGRGDYRTISEAIKSAESGTRILVRPGVYKEGLTIDKQLEIIGDGPIAEIIIESTDSDCILMQTDYAVVRGLTLRGQAGLKGNKYFGVNIPQGQLILEECDITSDSLACVGIHGSAAKPVIRQCKIYDSKEGSGVFVYENGEGIVEDCNIFGNALSGVAIKEGGNPLIRQCQIHDGKESGVHVYENGQGIVEDCDIFSNVLHGVAISEGSNPVIRRCKIYEDKQAGVRVSKKSQGKVEDCDIFGNGLAGVIILSGSNPTIWRCKIYDGKKSGVYVTENSEGTIEDCDIFGNALSGVSITEGSNLVIRQCRINQNKYYAVNVYDNGAGTVENCDLTGNARGAWYIDTSSQVKRSDNIE